MSQKIRKKRITKKEWYERGGFANSALFRLQSRGGAWRYYVNLDRYDKAAQMVVDALTHAMGEAAEQAFPWRAERDYGTPTGRYRK